MRVNYVLVGSFVLALLALLVATVAILSGRTAANDYYFAVYADVGGLKTGTQVLYQGYSIGQIDKIIPQRTAEGARFQVRLAVTEGWRIPKDSVAQVEASGLLTAVVINIREGKSRDMLSPGDTIAAGEPQNLFHVFSSVADNVISLTRNGIEPLMRSANQVVLGLTPALQQQVPLILDNLSHASGEARATLSPENRRALTASLRNLEAGSRNFAEISAQLETTRHQLEQTVTALNTVVQTNKGGLDESLRDLHFVLGTLAHDIESVTDNLEGTSRNMSEFSRELRDNPGLLLGSTRPPDPVPKAEKAP